MFYGNKELTIDDKGRLVLPALYRNEFQGGICFACYGLDICIELYPEETYRKKADKITSLNDFNETARKVKRTFLSNTFDVQIDSHNRILLPKPLVEKTKTGKKVVAVGMYDHLEIWDSDAYAKRAEQEEESYPADADQLIGTDK
ncbi:MAG: division/cell wall cluster transcriptional repressor MraZ [Bacilli bacterium]|jgi:MraZ protein